MGRRLWLVAVLSGACSSGDGAGKQRSTGIVEDSADSGEGACSPLDAPDLSGCLEVEETDPEARGRWPDILRRQYDASGHEVSRDVRGGEEPDTERVCRKEWVGDNLVAERCAGVSVYDYTYSYDTDGHLSGATYDAGSDGELDKVWTHITDTDGHVVESTVDDDVDGTPDAAQTFAWDADGHLLEETWDYTYDGVVDYRRILTWSGDLLVSEQEDSDGDGVIDEERVWEYNVHDQPTASFVYKDGNTTAAETTRWAYVGCVLDKRTVSDAGGNRTEFLYTHDDLGRQTLLVEDWEGDGTPDRVWATEWTCPGDHP